MKKLVFLLISISTLIFAITGCNQPQTPIKDNVATEIVEIDTLAFQLHQLDSLFNSGNLLHIDIYKLGKLKSIEFTVQAIDVEGEKFEFINLRKDAGNEYYYDWEDARILPSECQYLEKAINEIKQNLKRATDHEERYAYVTKDDIRVFASNEGGAKWKIALAVDYRKLRSEVNLSEEELGRFIDLLNEGLVKIEEISK